MEQSEILKIVEELNIVAESHNSDFIRAAVSTNTNSFNFGWLIENHENKAFTKSIPVDSIETAVEIIHKFSKNSKEDIKKGILETSNFDLNDTIL